MHPCNIFVLAFLAAIAHGQDGRHHRVLNHRRGANDNQHHPTFLEGNLGTLPASIRTSNLRLGADQATDQASLKQAGAQVLQTIAKDFLGATGNEAIVPTNHKAFTDGWGGSHIRYTETIDGLPVEGTALMMHVSKNGTVTAVNGAFVTASELEYQEANLTCTEALNIALLQFHAKDVDILSDCEQAIVLGRDGNGALAWKQMVGYQPVKGGPYQKDVVFASRLTGDLVAVHPKVYGALSLETYDCENGYDCTTLVSDSPSRISTGDSAIDAAHNYAIATYEFYYNNFGRDSIDDEGMTLISNVRYDLDFNNAYWDGTQMFYGDGDGVEFIAFSRDADVVGHEITHGVTERSSGLIYMDESGALNEAMSDIMGAGVDRQEGATIGKTFLVGEDIYTPGKAGDAMRDMADPYKVGDYDYWPTRYTGYEDNGGVHWNSGIANLAFTLMVRGGSHPRNKTDVVVPPMHANFDTSLKAALKIFYMANVGCLTPDSNFLAARLCTVVHAGEFKESVSKAWDAVGVPTGPELDHIPLSDGSSLPLQDAGTNVVTMYSLSGVRKGDSVTCTTDGDNGEARLFVRFDADPEFDVSSSVNDCVSSTAGLVAQNCTTGNTTAALSTAFVAVEAVASYQNLTIACLRNKVVYELTEGVPSTNWSAASGDSIDFKISGVRGNVVECKIFGPSDDFGDADLYVRVGAIPDISSSLFDCASQAYGSTETCSSLQLLSDDTVYATVAAYVGFSGVSITCALKNYVDLTGGYPQYGIAASANTTLQFRVQNVVAGTALDCWTEGYQDSDDVQLFTRFGALPEIKVVSALNACVSATGGQNQNCSTSPAPEDTYLAVSLYTRTGFQDLSLTCAKTPILLQNNVASSPFSAESGESVAFKLPSVLVGQSVSCKLRGNNGDADMYVDVSTVDQYNECTSSGNDSNEECTTDKVEASVDASISISAYLDFSRATLICKKNAAMCRVIGSSCTARSQCCAGFEKLTCDGTQSTNFRCVVCREANQSCSRNTQCCQGMTCAYGKCVSN